MLILSPRLLCSMPLDDGGGAAPPAPVETPVTNLPVETQQHLEQQQGDEPAAYVPPKGDEPWFGYLENVPEVLKPDIVSAFREMSANADTRIAQLTPYEALATQGIDPEQALTAIQFAGMLFGDGIDTSNPVAVGLNQQQRVQFFEQYGELLKREGLLEEAADAEATAEALRQQQEALQFETPEQKAYRELGERLAAAEALAAQTAETQAQAFEKQTEAQLVETYKQEWQATITDATLGLGQVSTREFKLISQLAQADPNQGPGVIRRAAETMLKDYGRIPDPVAATVPQAQPPVLTPTSGGAQLPAPEAAATLRFDDPRGRSARRALALEAIGLITPEGADSTGS